MPSALATTKRKFHKLLESISDASNPSTITPLKHNPSPNVSLPTAASTPLSKRARLSGPSEDEVEDLAELEKAERLRTIRSNIALRASKIRQVNERSTAATLRTGKEVSSRSPPYFNPWDRKAFLQRLSTFRSVERWRAKSDDRINEVAWARRGWQCVGKETVRCLGGCEKQLVIKLIEERREDSSVAKTERTGEEPSEANTDEQDTSWKADATVRLIDKYADLVMTAHEESCLWKRRGCDETIQRLPLAHFATAVRGLKERYESLLAIAKELPPVSAMVYPDGFEIDKDVDTAISLLGLQITPPEQSLGLRESNRPRELNTGPEAQQPPDDVSATTSQEVNRAALLLSLFGWEAEKPAGGGSRLSVQGVATCNSCFRRLGLWLFTPRALPSTALQEDPSTKEAVIERLDVVTEHRDYCPWINASSQGTQSQNAGAASPSFPGWQVLQRSLQSKVDRQKFSVDEDGPDGRKRKRVVEDEHFLTGPELVDGASSAVGIQGLHERTREEKDKELWTRLRRIKQIFTFKGGLHSSDLQK